MTQKNRIMKTEKETKEFMKKQYRFENILKTIGIILTFLGLGVSLYIFIRMVS